MANGMTKKEWFCTAYEEWIYQMRRPSHESKFDEVEKAWSEYVLARDIWLQSGPGPEVIAVSSTNDRNLIQAIN